MFFVYPTPQYPRRPLEYVYKTLYLIATVIHIVGLVVLIADFYTRLKDSMPHYFTQKELHISPAITMIMKDCTYKGELHLGSVKGEVEAGLGAITIGLMDMAMYTQGLFVLQFLLIVNQIVASYIYTSGNRHLRIFGVHIPLYHIVTMFTFVYSIAITVLTWVYENNRHFYHRALVHCANELIKTNPTVLSKAEYSDYSIFTTAVYWPFGAVCFGMAVYISAAIVLFVKSYDEATVLLSRADAPWEGKGLMCVTKKPNLKLHTAQRNAIVEDARQAIKEGEKVRIVRSYQLMTEEDFQTLVQAMKDQVARAIKEKQFEKLRENFGDNESQIDDMGFLWRQQMMAPPPEDDQQSPGTADQFYDVNFGDYFTDNDYNEMNNNDLGPLDGGNGIDDYDPMAPPLGPPVDLVEYNNDPLFPPEEEYGAMGGGGMEQFDESGGPYDENQYVDFRDSNGGGGGGDWGDEEGDFNEADGGHNVRRRHKHRRHRGSRSRGSPADNGGWGTGDAYGNAHHYDYDEPDPRSPAYSEYSPQEGAGRGFDDYPNGDIGRPSNRGNKKRKGGGGGRQAEVDDDLVDADALSDDPSSF